jgi:AmmeMemoRadiSam system protein A
MEDVYLPCQSQATLLALARRTLDDFVRRVTRETAIVDDPYLQAHGYGAFVTLYKAEQLRGCIGNCAPNAPLYKTVIEMTEAAASRDRRVEPIAQDELADIRIDISVLSPLRAAQDPLSLEAGKHGLHIARNGKRAVLLPQVASRYRWDMTTFLEQTCLKAGLDKRAWRDPDTELSSFTVLIIEEPS